MKYSDIPTETVQPDIPRCPACGIPIVREGVDGRGRNTDGTLIFTARPECDMVLDNDGDMAFAYLYWVCNACGCRWRNGQFSKTKGTTSEVSALGRAE